MMTNKTFPEMTPKEAAERLATFLTGRGPATLHTFTILETIQAQRIQAVTEYVSNTIPPMPINIPESLAVEIIKKQAVEEAMAWHDISTAPKDENKSSLFWAKHKLDDGYSIIQGSFFDGQLYADAQECIVDYADGLDATHWMPLPKAPGEAQQ